MAGLKLYFLAQWHSDAGSCSFRYCRQAIPAAQAEATSDDGDLVRDHPLSGCSDTVSVKIDVVRRAYNADVDELFSHAVGVEHQSRRTEQQLIPATAVNIPSMHFPFAPRDRADLFPVACNDGTYTGKLQRHIVLRLKTSLPRRSVNKKDR